MIFLASRLRGSAGVCAMAALGCAGAASADVAPATAPTPAPNAATADTGATQLGEIVVTAEKREEDVQRAALSVAVVQGATLTDRGAISLFDTGPLVAGMVFSRAPDDGLGLTFRGVGTPARNQSFDQSIALFVDGAFAGKGRLYGAVLFDVDRIEFVKSTESTLLGKNTDVGAISVVNRQPGTEFEADASLAGRLDRGGYLFDAGVDIPIKDDLSLRIAGHINDTNGYVHNSFNDNDYPIDQDYGVRATAVYQPVAWAKLDLSYQYTFDHRIGNAFQYEAPPGALPPGLGEGVLDGNQDAYTSLGENGESFHSMGTHIVNLTGDFDAGDLKITTISSYMHYNLLYSDDFDFGPKDGNDLIRTEHYWQASQEVRAASPTDRPLSYLGGGSVFYSDWISNEYQHYDTPLQVGPDPFDTVFLGNFIDEFVQRTLSLSVFGEGAWRINDRLSLAAGVRLTQENKDGSWARPAFAPFTLWNEILNPPFPKTPLRFHTGFPDGNASIKYQVTPDVMAYIAAGQGTKTGGFAESSAVPSRNPAIDARVGNEVSRSVEMGEKATVLGGSAHLNLAAFYVGIPNWQDTNFTGAAFVSRNIPIISRGFDGEFVWRLAPWLTWDNAMTFDEAKALLTPSFSPPQSPKWNGHTGLLVDTPIDGGAYVLRASGYVRYRSWMHNIDSSEFASSPLTTLDLSIGVGPSNGRWQVELTGTNVTNAISADFAFPPPDPTLPPSVQIASPAPLREITLKVSAKF
jgi:iron complex outermembrane receptor protein